MADDLIFVDNSELFKSELNSAILRALERCGQQAEGYAKDLVPVDTGNLRNSISHKVVASEKAAYIGVPGGDESAYGVYVELGTGIYATGGRPTPWNYKDEEGNWHHTRGQKAQPFLKPAVTDHKQTYRNIIEDEMKR